MSVMNLALFIASAAGLAAYVCRLDALSWVSHRAPYIVVHIIGAAGCAWVITRAGSGTADLQCIALLAVSVGWLTWSYRDWRNGPPSHVRRRVSARS